MPTEPTAEPVLRGARARARAEVTDAIKQTARRHLATDGAAALSLRAVARELGMVSSAVYRYVASRDELLTLLIIDAYDAVGLAAETAASHSRRAAPARRFVTVATAIRRWAVDHPHEFALIYGSPVPGYAAPLDTIASASRVTAALVGVVADAHRDGKLRIGHALAPAIPRKLADDLVRVRDFIGTDVPDGLVVRVLAAWTQLFGLISFELFGQTRNVIEAHADLFEATSTVMAELIGLDD
jgi:AcrR family transcriptional regulator